MSILEPNTIIEVKGGTITTDYLYTDNGVPIGHNLVANKRRILDVQRAAAAHLHALNPSIGANLWCKQTKIYSTENPIDSADLSASTESKMTNISAVVARTRNLLEKTSAPNIFITFGTDTVEYFAQALIESLSTTEMIVETTTSIVQRKIFILVTDTSSGGLIDPTEIAESQPGRVIQAAHLFAQDEALNGVVGIVRVAHNKMHNKPWKVELLAARGARKERTTTPSIGSRYESLAFVDGKNLTPFVSPKLGIAKPRLAIPEKVTFAMGQDLITQTPNSDATVEILQKLMLIALKPLLLTAKNIPLLTMASSNWRKIKHTISEDIFNTRTILVALPGSGNLRSNETYLRQFAQADLLASQLNIPLILFSDPLMCEQSNYDGTFPNHAAYIGDLETSRKEIQKYMPPNTIVNFINAAPLTRSEVYIIVSKIVAEPEYESLSFIEKLNRINDAIVAYKKFVYAQI